MISLMGTWWAVNYSLSNIFNKISKNRLKLNKITENTTYQATAIQLYGERSELVRVDNPVCCSASLVIYKIHRQENKTLSINQWLWRTNPMSKGKIKITIRYRESKRSPFEWPYCLIIFKVKVAQLISIQNRFARRVTFSRSCLCTIYSNRRAPTFRINYLKELHYNNQI